MPWLYAHRVYGHGSGSCHRPGWRCQHVRLRHCLGEEGRVRGSGRTDELPDQMGARSSAAGVDLHLLSRLVVRRQAVNTRSHGLKQVFPANENVVDEHAGHWGGSRFVTYHVLATIVQWAGTPCLGSALTIAAATRARKYSLACRSAWRRSSCVRPPRQWHKSGVRICGCFRRARMDSLLPK